MKQIAISDRNFTAHAFSLGSCFTFDGLALLNTLKGTFYLLRNSYKDMIIRAQFIPCHKHYLCMDSVGIRYEKTTIAILAARTQSEQIVAYVNNTAMKSLRVNFTSESGLPCFFTRMTRVRFDLVLGTKLVVNIQAYSGYLDVSCIVYDRSFCLNSSGLFGSCNNNTLDDLHDHNSSLRGGFGNTTEYNSTSDISSVTEDYTRNVFFKSWLAGANEDILMHRGLNRSSGPFALRINKTVLKTDEIFITTGLQTSVEVYIRVVNHGVVWTYSKREIFGVIANKTILIFKGSRIIDTGLSISLSTWYKISVTFDASVKLLKIYTVDMKGFFNLRTYTNVFSKDTFYPGGTFTIAGTYIPASGTVRNAAFVGDLYEVTIWNKTLSADEIRTQVATSISCNAKSLASMWKFEQIGNPPFIDCAADVQMKVVKHAISDTISWADASLGYVFDLHGAVTVFTNTEKLNQIEQRCSKIIAAYSKCIQKNQYISSIFSVLCIRELWMSSFSSFPFHTTASISVFCARAYQVNSKESCKFIQPVNREWSGVNCSKHCSFGQFDANDNCICNDGFFGQSCQSTCPGGFTNSCFGEGACHKTTGKCNCLRNFASSSCHGCSTNWTSADCGIALATNDRYLKDYTCQSFKNDLIGFSASGLKISMYGEFHLVKAKDVDLQARYVPCYNGSLCLHAVGVSVENANLTIYNPNVTEKNRNVWLNGIPMKITHAQMINAKLQISPVSAKVLKIIIYGTIPLNITITFLTGDMIVTVTSHTCSEIEGLCGSCQTFRNIDSRGNTSKEIVNNLMQQTRITTSNSVFLFHKPPFYESRIISGFEYMIHLNDSGITSDEITNLFQPTSDFTIEIFVKLVSSTGTLLSYSNAETTGIVVSDSFKIYKGREVIDCKIKPKLNVWVRLVFAYNVKLSILSVYQFMSRHNYEMERIIVNHLRLETKGHLQLGYWQATKSKPNAEQVAKFNGFIDEVRLWDKNFEQFFVESLHRPQIPNIDGLKAYWKFNEGHGTVFKDDTAGLVMRLPLSVNPLDVWRFSDQATFPFKHVAAMMEMQNETLKAEIDAKCSALIYHKDLHEKCGKFIGKAFVEFYYLSCIRESYRKGSSEAVYSSVLAYISYCQSITNVNKWPRLKICDVIPSTYYPAITATHCVIPCVFGKTDLVNVRCVCDHGYWGADCSNLCPGGKANTCSGKGDCNVTTGACDCQENWKGNLNCSACTPGWTGNECQLVVTPEPPSSVCSFFPGGHLVTLNAVHTTFYGHGEFYLLGNSTTDIRLHVHQVPCLDDKARCINGISLKVQRHLVSIKAALDDKKEPMISINQSSFEMSNTIHFFDDIAIVRLESSLYEITVANNTRNSLLLTLRNLGRELAVTLKVKGKYCNMSNSLCSTCFEGGRKLFDLSHGDIENTVRVPIGKMILSKSIHEATKFNLRFKGVGISTNVLPSLYFNKDITIELRFTATSTSNFESTLFSISGSTSFGVIVQGTLKLVVSRTLHDTTYVIEKDKLNQVTLVYSKALRRITLYFINSNGLIWQYKVDLPPWFTFLEPMSTLVAAEWISGFRDRFFYPATGFQGAVHEMRIWKHAYSFVDVKRLFERTVTRADPDILSLWKFDEGRGYLVRDLVSGVNLFIPPVASGPHWVRLTVDENALPVGNDVQFPNVRKKQEAIRWCHVQIYSSPLYVACNALARPSLR